MTERIYRKEYGHDNTRFGGEIYLSDFETDYRRNDNTHGSPIAQRIMSDWGFDKQCKQYAENRDRNKLYKNQMFTKERKYSNA